MLDPFQFLLVSIAGWMNRHQQQVIEYLQEENRVLREQLGNRRVLFNDDQRRRLAGRARGLSRKAAGRDRHSGHSEYLVSLASEADRPEVRWP